MIAVIDIGGTRTKYGVCTRDGAFCPGFPAWIATPSRNLVDTLVYQLMDRLPWNEVGELFVSIAANVDEEGHVLHATNLDIPAGTPFSSRLAAAFHVPVRCENDGTCAALAVAAMNDWQAITPLVVLTLGTGVGGGIILEGGPYRGIAGSAAEFGHLVIDPRGPRCGCGKRGCVEAFAGEAGILNRYNREAEHPVAASLELVSRISAGDELALAVVTDTGHFLGKAMSIISDIIAPRAFVLTGGVAGLGHALTDPIARVLQTTCFLRHTADVPVVQAIHDDPFLVLRGALELRRL